MSIFTTAVHSGHVALKPGQPSNPPIVTASGWAHEKMEDLDAALADERAGYMYSRDAAPTQEAFEAAMMAIEHGAGAAAFASGMAALHAALWVAGVRPGATLVAASELYGKSQALLNRLADTSGVTVQRVNIRDLAEVGAALAEGPRSEAEGAAARSGILLFEIISNPLCHVADAPALIEMAHRHDTKVVIDSTFTSPYLVHPLDLGADFVMHSATKYIGGHGDVLGGIVVATARRPATAEPIPPEP